MTPADGWQVAGSFVIAPGHPCLAGHFPGNPIVPGVVLLDQAIALLGQHGHLILTAAKFTAPVRPGQTVDVQCRTSAKKVDFTGSISGNGVLHGSARAA